MRDSGEKDAWIEQLAAAIADYVASHPNASDTIEGIHRWWLVNDPFEDDPSVVDSALERLVQRGVMTKRVLPDGRAVFSGKVPGVRPGRDCAPRSDEERR